MAGPWEEYQTNPQQTAGPILVRSREDVLGQLDHLNAPAAPAAAGPWTEYQKPQQPSAATAEERRTMLGFLGNIVSSTGHLLGGLVNVPEQVKGMTSLFAGMAEKSGFKPLPGAPDTNAVDALIAHYKGRYGSLEGFGKALYEDPAGVAFDVATVLEPAAIGAKAAGLPRLAAATTRVARAINPATQAVRLGGAAVSRGLPAIDRAMEAAAQGLRESALRRGYTATTPYEEVQGAARAMQGKPLTAQALEQVRTENRALQRQKLETLGQLERGGAAVPRSQILDGLQELRTQYEAQPLAARDVRQIDRAIAEVAETYPERIPLTKAEAIKEGLTWKEGMPPELQATAGAEKKIAEVIRNNLVEWAPELAELNKTQQSRIWLEKFMEGAINKRLNSQGFLGRLMDLRTAGGLTAGAAAISGPAAAGGVGTAALGLALLSDPVIQSHLAIAINKAQQLNPARWGRPNMGTAISRANQAAREATIPPERRLSAPAIVTEPPPDTSYVRAVPAQYPEVQRIPVERRLPAPVEPIVTPPPPDTSYVRAIPAEYPEVLPLELRGIPAPPARPPVIEVPSPRATPPTVEVPSPLQRPGAYEIARQLAEEGQQSGTFQPSQVAPATEAPAAAGAPPRTAAAASGTPAEIMARLLSEHGITPADARKMGYADWSTVAKASGQRTPSSAVQRDTLVLLERMQQAEQGLPPAVAKMAPAEAEAAFQEQKAQIQQGMTPAEPAPPEQPPAPAAAAVGTIVPDVSETSGGPALRRAVSEGQKPVRPVERKAPSFAGADTTIHIPGETGAYQARYAVRELDDVHPSHNPHTFQPNPSYEYRNDRNYGDAANQERIIVDSQPGRFVPEYLVTDSPDAVNGPPVISEGGSVLGGNSRAMKLTRVYAGNPQDAAAYRALLEQQAARFGIDPAQIRGMRRPVLVRELTGTVDAPQKLITDLNKSGTAALTGAERATADARRMSAGAADYLAKAIEAEGPEATLNDALTGKQGAKIVNQLVDDGVFTMQEKPQLIDAKTGALTAAAKERISKMLLGQVFADSDQMIRTPAEIRNKLERIVSPLLQSGQKPGFDILPLVRESLDMLEYAKAHDISRLSDVLAQEGLFGDAPKFSAEAAQLGQFLRDEKPTRIAAAFRRYVANAEPTMFGESTPAEAFTDAFSAAMPPEAAKMTPAEAEAAFQAQKRKTKK